MYEIVSDMNQKQEILEERVVALEERLGSIQMQLEGLPETLARVVQAALLAHRPPVDPSYPGGSNGTGGPGGPGDPARHTHLHPNDAASLATRPSWSAGSLTSGGNAAVAGGSSTARGALLSRAPLTPRTGSFDA